MKAMWLRSKRFATTPRVTIDAKNMFDIHATCQECV